MTNATVTRTVIDVPAKDVREGDVLLARTGSASWAVLEKFNTPVRRSGGRTEARVTLRVLGGGEQRDWSLVPTHLCRVLDVDPECGEGSCVNGVWHGRGYVENGVFKGRTGECFRCRGKGHQTREDRLRNWVYDQHRTV